MVNIGEAISETDVKAGLSAILLIAVIVMQFVQGNTPEGILALLGTVIGYYFGSN